MNEARELTLLYLPRGRLRDILDIHNEGFVEILSVKIKANESLTNKQDRTVGPLKISTTFNSISYISEQLIKYYDCLDLIKNYETIANKIWTITGENLLDQDRAYITQVDMLDKEHNWTVRFRTLSVEERIYTIEHLNKVIRGERPNFKTSLEFDNILRKQVWGRSDENPQQRARVDLTSKPENFVFTESDLTATQLQARIPNIYESVNKRTVLIAPEAFIRQKELYERQEF